MADPIFGEGSKVAVNDGASSAFVDFDDATDITPPAETQVVVDRNRLSATTLVEKAFSTRRALSQMTFAYEQGLTKYQRVEALKDNADHSFRITSSDNNLRLSFTGRVISNAWQGIQGGGITMCLCTVELTSLITVADASP